MANCIIYKTGSDAITYFVKKCIKTGNDFVGSNIKLYGLKPDSWSYAWIIDNTVDNKKVSECTTSNNTAEIQTITHEEKMTAIENKQSLSY